MLPLAVRGFVRVIELLMNACVWLALSLGVGMNAWSVLGVIGRAAAGMATTRQASAALTVVMAVGVLATYGLQRMLGFPQDTGKAASPGTAPNNRTKEESPR